MAWTTVWFAAGAIVAVSAVLLGIGLRNPRLMLQDYPKDVQAAVAPKTPAERRETIWWSVPILTLLLGLPLAAALALKLQRPELSFFEAALAAFVVLIVFNLWDWLVLDWLVFCTLTPRIVVIPGTEGMAGYRDYGMHFRGFLIGIGISIVTSVPIGLVTVLLPL